MDIESDDSERWEDFFGSSTSLLGIYDILTNIRSGSAGNSHDSHKANGQNASSQSNYSSNSSLSAQPHSGNYTLEEESVEQREHSPQLQLHLESDSCSSSSHSSSLTLTSGNTSACHSVSSPTASSHSHNSSTHSSGSVRSPSGSSGNKPRNNIRVLSRNVQRIITHSDAEPVDAIDIEALQQQAHSPLQSPLLSQRFPKKPATPPNGRKLKLSNIPLSRNTGKLTQSGNDLVKTFDSSNEYLDALSVAQQREKTPGTIKKPPTPGVLDIPGAEDEKTPTNTASPFSFDGAFSKPHKLTLPTAGSQESIKLIEMEQLATTAQMITAASTEPTRVTKEFVATEPQSPFEVVEAINYTLLSQSIEQVTLQEQPAKTPSLTSVELIEAINTPLVSKHVVRSSSAACASTVTGSPLLTYARSKCLAAKANTIGGPVPIKIPTAEELEELEEASKISAESLDRLTDIKSKFSPNQSRKLSGHLPDIAKLKLRPLSSSSICSTSSSSSSGSDQLNSKLHTSYQASAESLADQSENEMMDLHAGFTVFQRACMEIVDSERSYVEDLGQVIRGYLNDWKKRACLSYDELRILFSNIEEIYDFNSTLLKQLINSGMDPAKIAKCFIDLRERFDVYTTYCTSYPEAISLLTKLLQATHTNSLLTFTQRRLRHTLPLGSYLLKPVQRILKYHLLLDNLRKHCDVKEVLQAYELMRQVARHIDQVKRKLEQQSRVKELSGILDGWLGPELTVLGELRQEGLLMEHNKPRMVFLFGTMLIITKPKEDNRLQFKSYIHQNNLMLSEHLPGEPTSFYVIPYDEPRNQIKLTAKNRDQKRLWAQHIKGAILEKFDNIPNRAKELVYKLGDEEDRTPDKTQSSRKWSLHSASTTPVYLERRNQYRRSEIRNRSKFKRKTVTNSSSFDSFNELNETKVVPRNQSMDDSMLPALQKLAAAVKTKQRPETAPAATHALAHTQDCKSDNSRPADSCLCILVDKRSSVLRSPKSPIFGGKALKERSKSVPRISLPAEDLEEDSSSLKGSNPNLDARTMKPSKSLDIKQYNHKTMPKRIATLKKQRKETTGKKETSKFYMDLSEFEVVAQNVLKITESTEDLTEHKHIEQAEECKEDCSNGKLPDVMHTSVDKETEADELLSPSEKAKKDAQIILDLLQNKKEFERNRKKAQKKRSFENGSSLPTSPEPAERNPLDDLPPRPPSRSPPPLELESDNPSKASLQEEPIYESLLRNVHVPYKFSPVLGRSKSAQYYNKREKKLISLPRPESDYVTLVYSPEGMLQKVGEDALERERAQLWHDDCQHTERTSSASSNSTSSTTSTTKRDSQRTVISVECSLSNTISELTTSTPEAIYSRPMPKTFMMRLLNGGGGSKSSQENISTSEASLLPRTRKSIENISLAFGRSNKPPERRVSDVTEMCRQSILHRQGSEAVGERMAHVDYADPRTLFSVANSEASLQRDSVFSLTSSSDSVCEHKRVGATASSELSTNFEYEDDVEACLENDFRDSAIYSDDNEKRLEHEAPDEIKRPSSPPPPPPRPRSTPLVPPKPAVTAAKCRMAQSILTVMADAAELRPAAMGSIDVRQEASRSWVLQQIENFNK